MLLQQKKPVIDFSPYVQRYRNGEWRAPIFRDMVLADVKNCGEPCSTVLLDIGCGRGFDDSDRLQSSIAERAGKYIGIEPDTTVALSPVVQEIHHCVFEDASLEPNSVDVAFAVMVLEHLKEPARFWAKLRSILRPGGVFWGFTVDARHYFAKMSLFADKVHVKDWYLDRLHGRRGEDRYANYQVFYRCNTPKQICQVAHDFESVEIINFRRIGELDSYLPKRLRWFGRGVDRTRAAFGLPGHIMAVRAVK